MPISPLLYHLYIGCQNCAKFYQYLVYTFVNLCYNVIANNKGGVK